MNIGDVCKIVKELKEEKYKYIADECVREGYGQTCGGYLSLKNTRAIFYVKKRMSLNIDMLKKLYMDLNMNHNQCDRYEPKYEL